MAELSDSDIFSAAISDAPNPAPASDLIPTPAIEQPAPVEQPAPAMVTQPNADPAPAAEPTIVNEQGNRVPLSEFLDQREKRQAAERRAEEAERRIQEMERRQQPQQRQPLPDVLERPDDFAGHLMSTFEKKMSDRMIEYSFNAVRRQDPAQFDQAFSHLKANGSAEVANRIRNSADPGYELISWFKREETLRQIGDGGLESYRQKTLDEAMKDPAFRAKAMEAWRTEAQQQPQPGARSPNPALPSLNRTTGGAPNPGTSGSMTSADIFAEVAPRR